MGNLSKRLSAVVVGLAAAMVLPACAATPATPAPEQSSGSPAAEVTLVKVGASPVPHARILEFIDQNLAAAAGIDLEIREFDDFVLPNEALASGEIDANYFQHLPYLEAQIAEKGYQFEHGAGVTSSRTRPSRPSTRPSTRCRTAPPSRSPMTSPTRSAVCGCWNRSVS